MLSIYVSLLVNQWISSVYRDLRSGVCKLLPADQIQLPDIFVHIACELRMAFAFSKGYKTAKRKKKNMQQRPYVACKP